MSTPTYSRAILKISGESFSTDGVLGIDPDELNIIASQIAQAVQGGTQLAVVVGGGNMIRGAELASRIGIPQATADYMGMMSTIMNSLALQSELEKNVLEAICHKNVQELIGHSKI